MKAVIQKVSSAETIVDGELVSSIKKGVVIFLYLFLLAFFIKHRFFDCKCNIYLLLVTQLQACQSIRFFVIQFSKELSNVRSRHFSTGYYSRRYTVVGWVMYLVCRVIFWIQVIMVIKIYKYVAPTKHVEKYENKIKKK